MKLKFLVVAVIACALLGLVTQTYAHITGICIKHMTDESGNKIYIDCSVDATVDTTTEAYLAGDCTEDQALTQKQWYNEELCVRGVLVSEVCFSLDFDLDGVVNCRDKCREKMGLEDNDGCPLAEQYKQYTTEVEVWHTDPPVDGGDDIDGDGIKDSEDTCDLIRDPTITSGCPDADGDGIFDDADKCAETPAGTAVDTTGCVSLPIIDGHINSTDVPDSTDTDTDTTKTENGFDNEGAACCLTPNSSAVNALSALLLAISLVPIGIRRKIK